MTQKIPPNLKPLKDRFQLIKSDEPDLEDDYYQFIENSDFHIQICSIFNDFSLVEKVDGETWRYHPPVKTAKEAFELCLARHKAITE